MRIYVLAFMSAAISCCYSQEHAHGRLDSVQHVREVVVVSKPSGRDVIPAQRLNGEQLERLGSYSVADAMRYFSGIQIKDYGGVGGIKTINVRSMGSSHLGVYYDGVELGNAQNGQVDLGLFSLDNVEEIALYNGQKSAIFQPASDFGNAGSVYIRTKAPSFAAGKPYNLKTKVKYGSSGEVWSFSSLYEQRLSSAVSSSVSVGALTATGKYKFRYRRSNTDGTTAYDTTAVRQNGDMWAIRAEANLYGVINGGNWMFKAYTYNSERGIPGAIVNNVWRRGERQWDHNTFFQGSLRKEFSERFSSRLTAKYAYYDTHYVNNDTTTMLIDNYYKQQEVYVSLANVYEILKGWSASVSYDFKWNKLNSDLRNFVFPRRYSHYVSVATAYDGKVVKVQGSLLGTFVKDNATNQAGRSAVSMVTPAALVSVYPFSSPAFALRAFAKKSFRLPTFNELYYTEVGNASLKPETAIQYNLGFVLSTDSGPSWLGSLSLQADGYYNTVHDKVVAYPKGQQFRWTMLNLGRVHIAGVDVQAQADIRPARHLGLSARLQYTFQQARDVTSPSLSYYEDQIPYIPRHSGSAIIALSYKGFDFNYSFIYVGERYSQQENIPVNHVQPWYTSDLGLTYRVRIGKVEARFAVEVNNLFSQDYDVILNYPMPKRNYAASVEITI